MPHKSKPKLLPRHVRGVHAEPRILQLMCRCRFYTGVANERCKKGIRYEAVKRRSQYGSEYPCLLAAIETCQQREYPTVEQARLTARVSDRAWQRVVSGYSAVRQRIGEGRGVTGVMVCPNCHNLGLHYRIDHNGIIEAHCVTPGCCSFTG